MNGVGLPSRCPPLLLSLSYLARPVLQEDEADHGAGGAALVGGAARAARVPPSPGVLREESVKARAASLARARLSSSHLFFTPTPTHPTKPTPHPTRLARHGQGQSRVQRERARAHAHYHATRAGPQNDRSARRARRLASRLGGPAPPASAASNPPSLALVDRGCVFTPQGSGGLPARALAVASRGKAPASFCAVEASSHPVPFTHALLSPLPSTSRTVHHRPDPGADGQAAQYPGECQEERGRTLRASRERSARRDERGRGRTRR